MRRVAINIYRLRALVVLFLAAAMAAGLIALAGSEPAKAAFPGANGKIVFSSDRDGDEEIFTMNPDGTGLTQLTSNTSPDFSPAWSADGTKIAFMSFRDGDPEIYTMDADGNNQTRLTNNPAVDHEPAWSPDGTKIAFESFRNGSDYEIYVMAADGLLGTNGSETKTPTNLTNNPAHDFSPAWSPNGKKIAFWSTRDGGNSEVYVMDANGANPTRLTNNPAGDISPTWSPNGRKIAFYSDRDGDVEVYTMSANGKKQKNRTKNAVGDYEPVSSPKGPAWSPNGKKIAFTSFRDGNFEIYKMNADGSNQTNLTNNSASDYNPDWQPT